MSRKAIMLVALLIDTAIDRRFTAEDGDRLVFRAKLAAQSPALGLVLELAAMREGGARLVLEPVEVQPADYPKLSEAEYMVSLYNNATVPRVLVAMADGGRRDALGVLREAVLALNAGSPPP